MDRETIVEEARKWIDVPWKHQGRSSTGVDCVGIPIVIARDLGISEHNPSDYPKRPDGTFVSQFRTMLREKRPSERKVGDILVFAQSSHPCHCGIMTEKWGQQAVLHAHAGRGKVVEETLEQAMSIIGKPIFCFAMPGIED